jgi:uncharacterized membrane protein YuzA (DUF378 family)
MAIIWLELISLSLIIIGALNWGLIGATGFNMVAWIAKNTLKDIEPFIYVLVGISAITHLFSRDYYLPFLGKTVYPCGSLQLKEPANADMKVSIKVQPNVNVIYWAAETNKEIVDNPWLAYSEYENTGVTRSDADGNAVLRFRTPASYKVPAMFGDKTLKAHVHYRTCGFNGLLSRVETVFM